MYRSKLFGLNLVLLTFVFAFSTIASAQATRTWVSGVGDDVNPCSRTAPCKTFAGAISKTATNGEINCLDPGGFGSVTITKSITIDCTGTFGSILSSLTNGIVINITAAADTAKSVRIRGIAIDGASTGINGIRIIAASKVDIENCVIDGVTTHGISVETGVGAIKVAVHNTSIRNIGTHGINSFVSGGGTANISVTNCLISFANSGLNMSTGSKAAVRNTTFSHNTTGILAGGAEVSTTDCLISDNTTGVSALSGGTIRLSGNTITQNGTGLSIAAGGSIISFNNNVIRANTSNGAASAFETLG